MHTPLLSHTISADDSLLQLKTSRTGLTDHEAKERLQTYGLNQLKESAHVSLLSLILAQFKNVLVVILLVGTLLSAFLGEEVEAITIGIIVLLAVVLGSVQEFRAEKAMEALKSMAAPTAKVIRNGKEMQIPANEVVPGDIILLFTGDRIPADARMIEVSNLKVAESALTGESLPVDKIIDALPDEKLGIGDRRNMVYAGTAVTIGRGKAVVTGTAMRTEFGKIAGMLQDVESESTPLEKDLDKVGKLLAKVALGVVIVIGGLGLYHGKSIVEVLLFGVALAVAVVPEALPAVVTISLALGVQRMVKRHALIRKLHAVETLGCTSIICSDKTGTLTKDEMTIRQIWTDGEFVDVSGTGYIPQGTFSVNGKETDASAHVQELLRGGILSSDAELTTKDGEHDIKGDPTEGAFVVAGAKANLHRSVLDSEFPRVGEIPFTSETKRMTTLHKDKDQTMSYTKGAPEMLLPLCTRRWSADSEQAITEKDREEILAAAKAMAGRALRVIAVARKGDTDLAGATQGMKFLGLVGMIDPPRKEAKDAIRACKEAGIRVVMITGDHPVTAEAIAKELAIIPPAIQPSDPAPDARPARVGSGQALQASVVTGVELEAMSDAELDKKIDHILVYARVSPSHKLRIVTALQKQGHIVAMTGDGVNDAPALKKADIGVAMGITGTDVSKEAAAMTLTDDNFASIVSAVEEGRGIFGNIKKYLMYLLSSNIGEIIIMTVASIFDWPLPLSAVQLLYLNLATDGLPALALAVDPPEADLMKQPPRKPRSGIFNRRVLILMFTGSVWLAIITLGIFQYALHQGLEMSEAMTMAFATLVVTEFVKSYNFRSDHLSAFTGMWKNKWLNLAIVWEIALLLCIIYVPFLQVAFGSFALTLKDWGIIIVLALSITPVMETAKWFIRRR